MARMDLELLVLLHFCLAALVPGSFLKTSNRRFIMSEKQLILSYLLEDGEIAPGTLLGVHAKCAVTKFVGVITAHAVHLTGCDQFQITGECRKGRPGQDTWVDAPLLLRAAGEPIEIARPESEQRVPLGSEAQCKVTKLKGIITAYAMFLTGSDRYCITPKIQKGVQRDRGIWLDCGQIKILKKSVFKREEVQSKVVGASIGEVDDQDGMPPL